MIQPPQPNPREFVRHLEQLDGERVRPGHASGEQLLRSPRSQLQDMAIGRPLIGNMAELPASMQVALSAERARLHPDGAGLMYIGYHAVGYYVGKTIMGTKHVQETIAMLDTPHDSHLNILRDRLFVESVRGPGHRFMRFNVLARVADMSKEGLPTRIDAYEKRRLDQAFGVSSKLVRPQMWVGFLDLQAHTRPAENLEKSAKELTGMLNEIYPDEMTVGALGLISRRKGL